jgi:hypothetical protein
MLATIVTYPTTNLGEYLAIDPAIRLSCESSFEFKVVMELGFDDISP